MGGPGARTISGEQNQLPRRCWGARDRGAGSIQMAILVPVVFAIIFATIQAGLWFHARNVATSAAQVSIEAARTYDGTAGAGEAAGYGYLSQVGGLDQPGVSVSRSATTTTAVVTGDMTRIVPLLPLPKVEVTSSASVERLTG